MVMEPGLEIRDLSAWVTATTRLKKLPNIAPVRRKA